MNKLKNAYAILIGVGHDLPESVVDATAIYKILSDKKISGYKKKNITLLTEKNAIRGNILKALDNLIENADEDATVFIFYSGHGGTYTDNDLIASSGKGTPKPEDENIRRYFFQPNDCTIENFQQTWVKAEEVRDKIQQLRSKRLIFFMDCCHAEGMTKTTPGTTSKKEGEDPVGLAQHVDEGRGISILTSCRADEKSYILPDDKNSLFTTCLIEALKGKNRSYFDEPYVRMTDVINYLMKHVPNRKPEQRPFVNIQMYDNFVLSRLPKKKLHKLKASTEKLNKRGKAVKKELVTVFRKQENNNNALLFVHGFSGESTNTFDSMQSLIQEDDSMKGWDMYPLGYTGSIDPKFGKGIWASVADIEKTADNLAAAMTYKYSTYKRFAIVAHSLGGLAVQTAVLSLPKEVINKISHVILFGTPSNGILNKGVSKKIDTRWKELRKSKPFIKKLRIDWNKAFSEALPFKMKVVSGTNDKDILAATIFKPFNKEQRVTVSGDHFDMVQPDSVENDSYQLVITTLNDNAFYNKYTNQEEIGNLLGKHKEVITKLLPEKNTLTENGLKQLLFALEGMDRNDEVMELLLQHPLAKNKSDLLGIMGGRLKRKFLQAFQESDGRKSKEYYSKGLEIAIKKNDLGQIYYLAINLAFLSLVYEGDKATMKEYASMALKATESDVFNSLWKNATIAEANMYLGNFEKAKKYYEMTAASAGVREKISIHTNAYMAYSSLMHTEDDEFILFLKTKFLS
ncbi:caspase family protein [Ulvibacter antarcticus]|uniref:Putative serine esterase DUF676 n=1 Tax=Ulvibacter antarcticus TaxID=442714 RepID=A0A3L9ZCC1_9FLAO|nr:caspase family protein [Ulvibacter antarcticus]RMA64282.1 putative serine esterase DUF676 [Ulvibacter antarcticus]